MIASVNNLERYDSNRQYSKLLWVQSRMLKMDAGLTKVGEY